jgi:hypothetical protein
MRNRKLLLALAVAGLAFTTGVGGQSPGTEWFDPVLEAGAFCGSADGRQPALLRNLILAKTETAPFQPVPPKPALEAKPVLYTNLGRLTFATSAKSPRAQAWFDQGVILAFAFNHAESQRAFREAQKIDPACALCYWGEALVLGPNINVPMMPEAQAPALAALAKAVELAPRASPQAWCMATSRADLKAAQITAAYGKRFTIEETFRDCKDLRFGMGLKATHIGSHERRDRLLLLAAMAQALLTLLGAAAESLGLDRMLKANTVKRRTHSLFRQGCYWYGAIPAMPRDRLSRLVRAFGALVAEQPVFSTVFGAL